MTAAMRIGPVWLRHAVLALLLGLFPAGLRAGVHDEPRPATATEAGRCDEATPRPAGATRPLELSLPGLVPFAQDMLAHHAIRSSLQDGGRRLRVELLLGPVQDLRLPEGNPATLYLPNRYAAEVLVDRRSRIPALWRLDETTVLAADIAYDIRVPAGDGPPVLDRASAAQLADYRLVRLYSDDYSGFAAAAFEARPERGLAPHRIYAIAGTHVIEHTDFRSWASGLTFGRAQFTSTAALELISDAAAYARHPRGGEVVLTGQSQGGLVAQGVGYMLQAVLDTEAQAHRLVHVVSWGATGAQEVILRMIQQARDHGGRGNAPELERHWAASDPGYARGAAVWAMLVRQWRSIPGSSEAAAFRRTTARMRVVGYFFEIDLFARAGTFPGTALAFPTALILPAGCDVLVVEALIGAPGGAFGVRLESHFLNGYRRAVSRGAIALARPALPAKWSWATDMLPALEGVGRLWLEALYLDGTAASRVNWGRCVAAPRWLTGRNRFCRETFWPGCAAEEASWCLIRDAGPGAAAAIPG